MRDRARAAGPTRDRQVAPIAVAHVFAGGDAVSRARIRGLPSADLVIAADSGADLASAAGSKVDLLVGDLDSINDRTLAAIRGGARIETHHPDKDATDLELALSAALRMGAGEVVVIGGGGGRLDHLLGNVAVITADALRETPVTWVLQRETAYAVHHRRSIPMHPGATFSVIPIGGDARGVSITGAKWPLDNATLASGASLGVSNRSLCSVISIAVSSGTLLVICPVESTDNETRPPHDRRGSTQTN